MKGTTKKYARKSGNKIEDKKLATTNLTKKEISAIRNAWNDDVEWGLVHQVPWDVKKQLDDQVVLQMEGEGKFLDSRAGNLYGGEAGKRFKDEVLAWIVAQLDQYRDQIREIVCIKSDYCKKRKEKKFEEEGYLVAIAVADALIVIVTGLPVPITLISVYIVKRRVLDRWCGCSETPLAPSA